MKTNWQIAKRMRFSLISLFGSLMTISGIIFFDSCKKEDDSLSKTIFEETFNDLNKWTLYGSPLPNNLASFQNRTGIFDNNGDPNYNSGAISKDRFSFANKSIVTEVYLDFSDPSGCWAAAGIGVANPTNQSWGGYDPYISMELLAAGDACWAAPSGIRRHAYLTGGYLSETGYISFGDVDEVHQINADAYKNKWTKMKIEIDGSGIPSYFIDDNQIFKGTSPIANSVRSATLPLWLGSRSSGSAGKAYHDNIKVIQNN